MGASAPAVRQCVLALMRLLGRNGKHKTRGIK